jgi:glucose-6-phosphate isomerase
MSTPALWKRFQQYQSQVPDLGLTLDVSRMRFEDGFLDRMAAPVQRAFEAMDALERGAIANDWHGPAGPWSNTSIPA